jgi:hypothetical protein
VAAERDFQLGDALQCQDGDDNNDPYPGDLTAFGVTWTAIDKDEQAGLVDGNDGDTGQLESLFHWTAGPDEDPSDVRSGEWFVDDDIWSLYDRLVIVLKAGNGFASFELEFGDLSGDWITAGDCRTRACTASSATARFPSPARSVCSGWGCWDSGWHAAALTEPSGRCQGMSTPCASEAFSFAGCARVA